jgi:hypothetical protein
VAVLCRPVALFLTVTEAFGTTAPCGSVTVPVIEPTFENCPSAGRQNRARTNEAKKKNLGRFFIAGAPPKKVVECQQKNALGTASY